MTDTPGIIAFGGYIPRLRLQRSAMADAHAWFNPALAALGRGERSMAGWDEDVVTMAVEAARDCLADRDRATIAGLVLASTTAPFAERLNAGIVKDALGLGDDLSTQDGSGSQRAGLAALLQALRSSQDGGETLVIASDRRRAPPASEAEFSQGDAAAAILVGVGRPVAVVRSTHSVSADFIDHFRAAGQPHDYGWETRWIRDEGYGSIAPGAVKAALKKAGLEGGDVDHFIFPATLKGVSAQVARQAGVRPEAVRDTLAGSVGDTGCAHPLLMLAHCLETAAPGQIIVVAAFGSGCDVLVLQGADALGGSAGTRGVSGWLARRREETSYLKFLSFTGAVELEKGMRAEFDQKQPLTALWRHRKTVLGLVGGRCRVTGAVQFPKTRVIVGAAAFEADTQDDYPLADRTARILTYTADKLSYSPEPPTWYGMIEFDGGGRMNAEFCDVDAGDVRVGSEMRMMFRIKAIDEQRGFIKYFWKAAPAH